MKQIFSKRWIAVLAILMISSAFSPDIVRRHDVKDQEYLLLGAKYDAVCKVGLKGGDGTLVKKNWVVTAAHVARGMSERTNGNVEIFFANRKMPYKAEAIFIHPDYNMVEHDIALIRLSEVVNDVDPIGFYRKSDEQDKEIIIAGHGYSKSGDETVWEKDGQKRAATNRIDEAGQMHIMFDFDRPGEPGVTRMEGTAGSGDSGGPALIEVDGKSFIAGISSAGEPGDKGPGTYGAVEYYTRVSTHIRWIDEVLNGKITATNMDKAPLESATGTERVITRTSGGPSGMFKGLGLILDDRGGKIEIHGKADNLVPKEFRNVMFEPPSILVSFNGSEIRSVSNLRVQFDKVNSGETYEITFQIQGEKKTFSARK
ncbi:MAG: trypsin-like serine protease [Cyclobacteriaceae bacterium]